MSYLYPYGDTQQLNLAWFLAKFKELYEYVMQLDPSGSGADIAEILSRFTEQYDSTKTYIPGDYCIHDGYIYKANTTTTGIFDAGAWDPALPVNDVQGLRILLGGLSTDLTTLEQNAVTNTQYTPGAATADGLLRQTKNGAASTVMTVDKKPTANSQNPVKSGAVHSELEGLKGYLNTANAFQKYYRRNNSNMVIFSDSWGYGTGATDNTKRFTTILCNRLGMTELNYSVYGAGFLRTGNLISSEITTASNELTAAQKENTGIVLFLGGVNDYRTMHETSTREDFATAIKNCMDSAHSLIPNALIVVCLMNSYVTKPAMGAVDWANYASAYLKRECNYPIMVLDNIANAVNGIQENYISDNLHLSDIGQKVLAGYIENALLGGDTDVSYLIGELTLPEGYSFHNNVPMYLYRHNYDIILTGGRINFPEAASSQIKIATIPENFAPSAIKVANSIANFQINGQIIFRTTGNVQFQPDSGGEQTYTYAYPSDFRWLYIGA